MFYQILFSPEGKQSAIISNKHGIKELPQEFPNSLSLESQEIWKDQENLKTSWNYNLVPIPSPKIKIFVNTSKKMLKNRN